MSIAARTDSRIQLVSQVISAINIVKMYAWETPFGQKILELCRYEQNILPVNSNIQYVYSMQHVSIYMYQGHNSALLSLFL